MKNKSITDYIMGGILVGLGLFFVWVFYPREEQQETKPEEIVEVKEKEENEIIPWTNDFTPIDLLGDWKGVDDVYIGYNKDTDEYTWRYGGVEGTGMTIRFTGKKGNGDIRLELYTPLNKIRMRRGTIETTMDGMKMRVLWEYEDGSIMEEKNYLQSFILIQNLYEDRLYVLYKYLSESKSGDNLSLEHYHMNVDLKKIVRELYSIHNLFDDGVKKSLDRSIDIRNRFIHFSFMKPDVYTDELCNVFFTLFREVDEEIRKFKKRS